MNEHFLGFGLGLRTDHYEDVLTQLPDVDWFEVCSENFMVAGGKPRYYLDAIKERYPIVMHGVSLSIGSSDPLNKSYLQQLKTLINHVQPEWVSDHLCWTSHAQTNSHDLLPLPYTDEAIEHVVERVKQVQDYLGRQLLLENVSSYLSYKDSHYDEWTFLNTIAEQADCLILLDINNIYVSARNHGFESVDYLQGINKKRVRQFHLAGHSDNGDYVIDTHDHDVCQAVWTLYAQALQRFGGISTMIERDANIPAFTELYAELQQAKQIAYQSLPELESAQATEIV
ncbi:MAG: DUF692 domain-containing protein [Methylococcales bacterium]